LIVLSALFDSYAAFVVKTKFNELGHIDFSSFSTFWDYMMQFIRNPKLLLAIIAFVAAPGLWFMALNRMDLSIGYPILVGFHLLFVLLFGTLWTLLGHIQAALKTRCQFRAPTAIYFVRKRQNTKSGYASV
jgi:multidrug transporter EmrE-like cation transporter